MWPRMRDAGLQRRRQRNDAHPSETVSIKALPQWRVQGQQMLYASVFEVFQADSPQWEGLLSQGPIVFVIFRHFGNRHNAHGFP